MNVLITGATGSLGRELVKVFASSGHTVRAMSRTTPAFASLVEWVQGDVATQRGLAESLAGVDAIVHAASDPRNADAVEVGGTRHLVYAARAAGVRHFLYVSIVGIDAIPFPYYVHKLRAEAIVRGSDVPYSILRTTQFHSLVNRFITAAARVPLVMPLPTNFKFQSVDESEVAQRLLRALADGPSASIEEYAGPEVLTLGEMARDWLKARSKRRLVIPMPRPGAVGAAFRAGKNTAPLADCGTITWREWLSGAGAHRDQRGNPHL
jgi:uncharacterized protein YbjT (DUF2867 family)